VNRERNEQVVFLTRDAGLWRKCYAAGRRSGYRTWCLQNGVTETTAKRHRASPAPITERTMNMLPMHRDLATHMLSERR
jgi:hypothetical protein